MKNFLERLKTLFSVLHDRNLLLTYVLCLLLLVLPVTVVSGGFFQRVYLTTLESVRESNRAAVERVAQELGATLDHFNGIGYKFQNIAIFQPNSFQMDPYSAVQTMKNYRNLSKRYDDVAIYYTNLHKVLLTRGAMNDEHFFQTLSGQEKLLEDIASIKKGTLFSTRHYGEQVVRSIDLIYAVPVLQSKNPQHILVFTIGYDTMLKSINDTMQVYEDDMFFVYDADGELLWTNQYGTENENFRPTDAGESDRTDRVAYKGEKYFMAQYSMAHGFTFYRLTKDNAFFPELQNTVRLFVAAIVIILALSMLAFSLIIKHAYRPVRQLIQSLPVDTGHTRELDIIRNASFLQLQQEDASAGFSKRQLKSLFVFDLIQSRHNTEEEIRNICRNLDLKLEANFYCAVCVLVDKRIPELRPRVEEALEKMETAHGNGYFYTGIDGLRSIGVVCLSSNSVNERRLYGRYIQSCFPEDIHVTVSFGKPYLSLADVPHSYLEARASLDYRLIVGSGSIIDATDLPEAVGSAPLPPQLMQDFINALHSWNQKGLKTSMENIHRHIVVNKLSLYQAKSICFDMASTFLSEAKEVNNRVSSDLYEICDIFSISEFDSLDELMANIELMANSICTFVEDNRERKNSQFMDMCIDYMRQNMNDSQFSLEAMADSFGVSSAYLRRHFKQLSGQTLSDCIGQLRIEKAKELLLTTDYDLNAITAEIGYMDVSSFIRKFRTVTGVSPGKFRAQHKNQFEQEE